jgi:hypothetical protein
MTLRGIQNEPKYFKGIAGRRRVIPSVSKDGNVTMKPGSFVLWAIAMSVSLLNARSALQEMVPIWE